MDNRAADPTTSREHDPATANVADEQAAEGDDRIALDDRIPLPEDARTALLAGIFILLGFYTIYFAREIVMPIVFALLLNFLLQPLMRLLEKLRVPAMLGALLAIALLLGIVVMLISSLAGPAADWAGKLPQSLSH